MPWTRTPTPAGIRDHQDGALTGVGSIPFARSEFAFQFFGRPGAANSAPCPIPRLKILKRTVRLRPHPSKCFGHLVPQRLGRVETGYYRQIR